MASKVQRLTAYCKDLARRESWTSVNDVLPAIFTAHETPDGSVYLNDIGIPVELFTQVTDAPLRLVRALPSTLAIQRDMVVERTLPRFFGYVLRQAIWTSDTPGQLARLQPDRKAAVSYVGATVTGGVMLVFRLLEEDEVKFESHSPNRNGEYANTDLHLQLPASALLAASKVMEEIGAIK